MWKATEEIGVGRAFGTKWGLNCTFIVARYEPKGNIDTEAAFKENVEKGTFDPLAYNCSAVFCPPEESQAKYSAGNNQQDNRLPDRLKNNAHGMLQNTQPGYSNMQRYREMYYKNSKGLGSVLRNRGGVNLLSKYSNPRIPSYQGFRLTYRGGNLPQFISNGWSEEEARPRSLDYRDEIPHTQLHTQGDEKVVWFIL